MVFTVGRVEPGQVVGIVDLLDRVHESAIARQTGIARYSRNIIETT